MVFLCIHIPLKQTIGWYSLQNRNRYYSIGRVGILFGLSLSVWTTNVIFIAFPVSETRQDFNCEQIEWAHRKSVSTFFDALFLSTKTFFQEGTLSLGDCGWKMETV